MRRYEIPGALLDAVDVYMYGEGNEPCYAEIDDDAQYIDPTDFGRLSDDPDYEDMMERLANDAYVEITDCAVHVFAIDESNYGNHGDTYCNDVVETSFNADSFGDDADYANGSRMREPDVLYGLETANDPYTFAGGEDDDGGKSDANSDASNDEIYSVANDPNDATGMEDPDRIRHEPGDVYGLNLETLRRDSDETYGLSHGVSDNVHTDGVFTTKPPPLRKKAPTCDTLRMDKPSDVYENSTNVHSNDQDGKVDDETYENHHILTKRLTRPYPVDDKRASIADEDEDDCNQNNLANAGSATTLRIDTLRSEDKYGLSESPDGIFSTTPLESPLATPKPEGQMEAFRALLDDNSKGAIVYGSHKDCLGDTSSSGRIEDDFAPVLRGDPTYSTLHKFSNPPTLPTRSMSARVRKLPSTTPNSTAGSRSVDDIALTLRSSSESPQEGTSSSLFAQPSSFVESDNDIMFGKGLHRNGSRISLV